MQSPDDPSARGPLLDAPRSYSPSSSAQAQADGRPTSPAVSATVTAVRQASPSVRILDLKVTDPRFAFAPGQWVDFFITGVDAVGGFSICSSPRLMVQSGAIQLAIKNSGEPPAAWVHSGECVPGAVVSVKVGGSFRYDNPEFLPVLLVAGGIGISPLMSMVRHILGAPDPVPCTLLYCASSEAELVFRDELEKIASGADGVFRFVPMVTRGAGGGGRVSRAVLARHLPSPSGTRCFLCGPPGMSDGVMGWLRELGVPGNRIRYEKWW
ncbi:unnamed protein product [Ostreobium quekettii]|uniref:Oxidoreductase NAD-binding domain-containing protein 1 n=1 Tax=Ostreobium quekettii TaxID=121088 RepID=A0A8S1JE15_9CHLO|nr:unnamed protein product [Ostreobium quekettii]